MDLEGESYLGTVLKVTLRPLRVPPAVVQHARQGCALPHSWLLHCLVRCSSALFGWLPPVVLAWLPLEMVVGAVPRSKGAWEKTTVLEQALCVVRAVPHQQGRGSGFYSEVLGGTE